MLERILLGGTRPHDRLQSLGVGVRASEAALQPGWTSLTNAYTQETRMDSSQVVDVWNRARGRKKHTSHLSHSPVTTLGTVYHIADTAEFPAHRTPHRVSTKHGNGSVSQAPHAASPILRQQQQQKRSQPINIFWQHTNAAVTSGRSVHTVTNISAYPP